MAYYDGRDAARLTNNGDSALGTITELESYSRRQPFGSHRSRTHNVYFWFIAEDGQRVETVQKTSENFYAARRVGEEIPIRYWRDDPTLAEALIGKAARQAQTMRQINIMLLILTAVFAALAWRRARRAAWLREHGVHHWVRVLAHVDVVNHWGWASVYLATWREDDGRKGASMRARLTKLPPVGAEITICVDPRGRWKSVWLGDLIQ